MAMPTLRTEIKRVLIIAFWVVFSLGYFDRFPLPGFLSKVYLILLAGLVTASACGYGTVLVNRLIPDSLEPPEFMVFSAAVGFGILSLGMVFAGAVGLWTHGGAVMLIVPGLLLRWRYHKKRHSPRSLAGNPSWPYDGPPTTASGMTSFVPFFLIATGAILSLLIAFSPITYYDSLVYHFALPQAYIQARHWIGHQELIYSAFPQTMEMIWTLGTLLGGDLLANLLGWGMAVVGVLAVYSYAKRFLGSRAAIWAAVFLSVMPAYLLLSSGGYVDVSLAVFSFLSFYALCLWKESQLSGCLVLAGALGGWAMGTKYTGAIALGIGMLIILKETHPRTLKTIITHQTIYAGVAFLVFSPWLVKNLYYMGNPVFPFLHSWSLKPANPWLGAAAEGYFRGLTEYAPRSGWHLFKLIWDMAVHGLDFGGGMDVLGDLGWAPLFAFLPTVLLARKKTSHVWLVLFYCICFFLAWGMSRPVLRFFLPLAPFLALGAAYGYDQGVRAQTRTFRLFGQAFLTILLLSNFRLFFEVTDVLSLFRVPLGFESSAQYLSRILSNNYYPAASFINHSLSNDTLTYVIGDQRSYYYNRPILVTPAFNKNPLTEWANEAISAEDLAARLKARHITHLLINDMEMKRLDSAYHIFPFTPKGQKNWETLRSRLAHPVYRDNHCEVLAL